MYQRTHHRRIWTVLQSLNADLLRDKECYFGGGTAIALTHGEFRESRDIDFLISNAPSYQDLRAMVKRLGPGSLFSGAKSVHLPDCFSNDEYGIRGWVMVDAHPIKFEIVHEGRISLTRPHPTERIGRIQTLTRADMVAEKLMANSDRFPDTSTFQRDLFDLAFMNLRNLNQHPGWAIANAAYGDAIDRDLGLSVSKIIDNPEWLNRCLRALVITADAMDVRSRIHQLIGL